ncbi:hypothetical protein Cni_G11369 [Canna indica]|uniref:AP2/ERF domain-containing protein n=1 Tax=Canna indica TaxID=4628 RepID=A0AAQ3K671_9LILI|nr:hypothetical protein Cni_G11369 [Canna indica]
MGGGGEMAARAYDAAVYCLRGPDEEFNFPDKTPNIQGADSLSRYEILEAAVRHAREGEAAAHAVNRTEVVEGGGGKVAGEGEGSSRVNNDGASEDPPVELLPDFYYEPAALDSGGWTFWGGNGDGGDDDGHVFEPLPLWDFTE